MLAGSDSALDTSEATPASHTGLLLGRHTGGVIGRPNEDLAPLVAALSRQ